MYSNAQYWLKTKPTVWDNLRKGKILQALGVFLITLRGKYYHIEFVHNNIAYSSTMSEGVRAINISKLNKDEYEIKEIQNVNIADALERFGEIRGFKYDWLGIFLSQMFPINKHHPKKLFCSETVAHMLRVSTPHFYGVNLLDNYLQDRNRHIKKG